MKKLLLAITFLLFANANNLVLNDYNEVYVVSLIKNPVRISNIIFQNDINESLANDLYSHTNAIANEHNVIVIKADGFNALIDTGFVHTKQILINELVKLKLKPKDITHIILTHSHGDHIGGLDLFPKAKILVHEKELNFWKQKQDISKLNISTFKDNEELIKKGSQIFALNAFGHTPGHSLIAFSKTTKSNKDEILKKSNFIFVADIFHFYDLQIISPVVAASFDNDKFKAIEARKDIMEKLKTYKIPFIGTHMPTIKPLILQEQEFSQTKPVRIENNSANLNNGKKLYNKICQECHGINADVRYKNLVPALISVNDIAVYMHYYQKNARNRYNLAHLMQEKIKNLTQNDIDDIQAYIRTLK